jgi:hypothetical protein
MVMKSLHREKQPNSPLQKTQGWGSLKLWSSMEPKRKGGPAPSRVREGAR